MTMDIGPRSEKLGPAAVAQGDQAMAAIRDAIDGADIVLAITAKYVPDGLDIDARLSASADVGEPADPERVASVNAHVLGFLERAGEIIAALHEQQEEAGLRGDQP
jgi:hypothetical protein